MRERRLWTVLFVGSAVPAVTLVLVAAALEGKNGNPLYLRNIGYFSVGTLLVTGLAFALVAAGAAAGRHISH